MCNTFRWPTTISVIFFCIPSNLCMLLIKRDTQNGMQTVGELCKTDTDTISWVSEATEAQMLKTMEIMLQRHNKIEKYILNVPIFTFKIWKSILDLKISTKIPYTFQSVLLLVFIYMHSCEKEIPITYCCYAKCIKKSMKNDSKGRARTKTKQKVTKIKSKCASTRP